jgi:leucyl aminopeptidase (aminopeptidase T)
MDVVTNNKAELLDAVQPSSQRRSAMELVEKTLGAKPLPEDYREELRKAQARAEEMASQRNEEQKQRMEERPKAEMSDAERLREQLGQRPELPNPEQAKPQRKPPDSTRGMQPRMLP